MPRVSMNFRRLSAVVRARAMARCVHNSTASRGCCQWESALNIKKVTSPPTPPHGGRKGYGANSPPVEQPRVAPQNLSGQSTQPLQQRLVPPLRDEGACLGEDQPRQRLPVTLLAEEHRGILDVSRLFQQRCGGVADLREGLPGKNTGRLFE